MDEERIVTERSAQTADGSAVVQRVQTKDHVSPAVFASRIIYYVGGMLLTLLFIRFLLFLLGASRASSFVDAIYSVSGIFVAPFSGIFSEPTYGTSKFDSATVVAIVIYTLIISAIAKLVTMGSAKNNQ